MKINDCQEMHTISTTTTNGEWEEWVRFSSTGRWMLWMGDSLEDLGDQPELEFEFQKLTKDK